VLAVELAAVAGAPMAAQDGEVAVTGVTHSSSAVRPGDLYAALPGARFHGAQFADQARAAMCAGPSPSSPFPPAI